MKKYEKIEKMTSPEELKATEKDITKYENKVQIYIRYIATQNQAEIEKRRANMMRRLKSSPAKVAVVEGARQALGSPSKIEVGVQQKQQQHQSEKPKSPEKVLISAKQIISPVKPSSPVKVKTPVKQQSPAKAPSPSKINPEIVKMSLISP